VSSKVICPSDGYPCDRRSICHVDSPRSGDSWVCPRFVEVSHGRFTPRLVKVVLEERVV
jgi:hypothetical protein